MKILALFHTQAGGGLPKAALEVLTAAAALKEQTGGTLAVGIIGQGAAEAADNVAGCGAASFLTVSAAAVAQPRYATDTAAAAALIKESGSDLVMAPGTARFARCLPGAAHRAGAQIDTHIVSVKAEGEKVRAQRWFYRQRILVSFSRTDRPWIILADAGVNAPWQGAAGTANAREAAVNFSDTDLRTSVIGTRSPAADAQTIKPDVPLLFVAGAGWTKKQAAPENDVKRAASLILDFLDKTKASLGSSKSLVDQSHEGEAVLPFLTHLNQVGQTGATPRHQKGLATCCHGEEPHVVGWRFINERRAINTNESCGWAHGKTDVLYVADAFAVMAEVNRLLSAEG